MVRRARRQVARQHREFSFNSAPCTLPAAENRPNTPAMTTRANLLRLKRAINLACAGASRLERQGRRRKRRRPSSRPTLSADRRRDERRDQMTDRNPSRRTTKPATAPSASFLPPAALRSSRSRALSSSSPSPKASASRSFSPCAWRSRCRSIWPSASIAWMRLKKQPSLRTYALAAGLGIMSYYVSSWLNFEGLKYVSAQLERLILYIYPTMVAAMSWFFLKDKITGRHIIALRSRLCRRRHPVRRRDRPSGPQCLARRRADLRRRASSTRSMSPPRSP